MSEKSSLQRRLWKLDAIEENETVTDPLFPDDMVQVGASSVDMKRCRADFGVVGICEMDERCGGWMELGERQAQARSFKS